MTVELLTATPDPEQTVCLAARNDYRADGVANYTFEEVMSGVDVDDEFKPVESVDDDARTCETLDLEAKKRSLLKRLMKSGHWGPAEHPSATLALEGVTRVAMAQITRHRHFTFDIMSLRYVNVEDDDLDERFEVPPEVEDDEVVTREGVSEVGPDAETEMEAAYYNAVQSYQRLMEKGVPKEEARKVLPMGTKVNIVMSGNARAWMHLLNIRGKANVQGEARRLADQIHEELVDWMPYTFEHYSEEMLPMGLNP